MARSPSPWEESLADSVVQGRWSWPKGRELDGLATHARGPFEAVLGVPFAVDVGGPTGEAVLSEASSLV